MHQLIIYGLITLMILIVVMYYFYKRNNSMKEQLSILQQQNIELQMKSFQKNQVAYLKCNKGNWHVGDQVYLLEDYQGIDTMCWIIGSNPNEDPTNLPTLTNGVQWTDLSHTPLAKCPYCNQILNHEIHSR